MTTIINRDTSARLIPTGVEAFDFMPGNGNRYNLLFGSLPDGRLLLAWMDRGGSGGRAFRFDRQGFVAASYAAEKLELSSGADVAALLAFIALFDIPVGMPQGFDANGIYSNSNSN